MRRRHREIAGGEVAMMAVITKAMGAFLVLMILLLPYYTGDTQSQQTVDETKQRIDEAKAGLDGAVDKLKKGRLTDQEIDDLLKSLMLARDELVEAQNLIAQLRVKIDQMASQINRLEKQNAALQAQVAKLQSEVDALKVSVSTLTAENLALKATIADLTAKINTLEAEKAALTKENAALKAEIERLKAFDPAVMQARIKELEKQVEALTSENTELRAALATVLAKMTALEDANAALTAKNTALQEQVKKLENENEVLRTLAAFPTIYLSSKCDREDMIVDLVENPINLPNYKPIEQFIPTLMPWTDPSVDWASTQNSVGDVASQSTTNVTLSFEEGKEYDYDFFVRLIYFRHQDKTYFSDPTISDTFYQQIDSESPKKAEGSITSHASHPNCVVNAFLNWQGNFKQLGAYQLGPVEPVIHLKRMFFAKDHSVKFPTEDRPNIEMQIADATCARYPSFCELAKQHAKLRAEGSNPWQYTNLESFLHRMDKPELPPIAPEKAQVPEASKTAPDSQQGGPPPPPVEDRTVTPPPKPLQ